MKIKLVFTLITVGILAAGLSYIAVGQVATPKKETTPSVVQTSSSSTDQQIIKKTDDQKKSQQIMEIAAADTAPKVFFPQMRYEFKSVMEGEKITHDFIIENKGKDPLIIKKVQPG